MSCCTLGMSVFLCYWGKKTCLCIFFTLIMFWFLFCIYSTFSTHITKNNRNSADNIYTCLNKEVSWWDKKIWKRYVQCRVCPVWAAPGQSSQSVQTAGPVGQIILENRTSPRKVGLSSFFQPCPKSHVHSCPNHVPSFCLSFLICHLGN